MLYAGYRVKLKKYNYVFSKTGRGVYVRDLTWRFLHFITNSDGERRTDNPITRLFLLTLLDEGQIVNLNKNNNSCIGPRGAVQQCLTVNATVQGLIFKLFSFSALAHC